MARTSRQKRRPTEADLNDRQRRIYEALPPELRDDYLSELPAVGAPTAISRKKAQQVRSRLEIVDRVICELQSHRRQLQQLAKNVEQGAGVNLRKELKLPELPGVSMRYVRGGSDE